MSEKPLNPLGVCTEEEIEFVNTLRGLSPPRYECLRKDAQYYIWLESMAKDSPEEDPAEKK